MKVISPRTPVHRGSIEAIGFLINPDLISLERARERILSLWEPGVAAYRLDLGLVVKLPNPRRVDSRLSPGLPLTREGLLLAGLPLSPGEIASLSAAAESVVVATAGVLSAIPLERGAIEQPESWLDVDDYRFIETLSLGAPPWRPRLTVESQEFDARSKMEGVPPESEGLREFLKEIKRQRSGDGEAGGPSGLREMWAQIGFRFGRFVRQAVSIKSWARRIGSAAGSGSTNRSEQTRQDRSDNGFAFKLGAALKRMFTRALLGARLGRIFGRRQAEYLTRLIDMLESGDTLEALKHAIPLGGGIEKDLAALALGVPRPRTSLSINPRMTAAASSIGVGQGFMDHLRRLYRAAFERLAAQGRIEEAAFILSELLFANEEAVAFLEKHGRLRLAAEMAEARELAPGIVVRQWFIAGDTQRAIRIARRLNAFSAAIVRLERSDKAKAYEMRLLWAESLAASGDYAGAVEAVWPVKAERQRALDWIDKAVEAGGPVGARMLARKASIAPELFGNTRDLVLGMLEDERAESAAARLAFADTIRRQDRIPECQTLARAAVRAVLRDAKLGLEMLAPAQFRHLIDFAGDGALRSDAPPLPSVAIRKLVDIEEPVRVQVDESDVGTLEIKDLAYLPDGKMIVALGEAGASLVNREGRRVAHFDVPAHRLVISDHGDRAIAIAPRGESSKLSRIDFLSRKSDQWCEGRIGVFAGDYDGSSWFVAVDRDLYTIDATSSGFEALWRIPEMVSEGKIISVARSADSCRVLLLLAEDWPSNLEEWHYQLPSMTLRGKGQTKLPDNCFVANPKYIVSNNGMVVDCSTCFRILESEQGSASQGPTTVHSAEHRLETTPLKLKSYLSGSVAIEAEIGGHESNAGLPAAREHWVAVPVSDPGRSRVVLFHRGRGNRLRAELLLNGSATPVVRLTDKTLCVADERGRVYVIDLDSGRVLRNIRL
jgi:hypothetical protein